MIRNDFTVSPYQIYVAKLWSGPVLLICALLPTEEEKNTGYLRKLD